MNGTNEMGELNSGEADALLDSMLREWAATTKLTPAELKAIRSVAGGSQDGFPTGWWKHCIGSGLVALQYCRRPVAT